MSAIVECEIPACDVTPAIQPCDIHVLLVDDEVLSRMVVTNMLVKNGYTVTAVETGKDALERLAAPGLPPFTLLMTDVAMPGITGLEILSLVRKTPALDHIPVVMMSAHQNAGTVFECVRMGADDYILKPVGEKEVHHLWQHVYRRQMVVNSRRRLKARASQSKEDKEEPRSLQEELAKTDGIRKHVDKGDLSTAFLQSETETMSVEEMRAYCNTMIEKYQKVLYVIDNFPELFPAKKRSKGEEEAAESTGASSADVESLTKSASDLTV